MSYGLREALLCLHEFLDAGTSTQYGTVRDFNSELSGYRTEKGLDSDDLPDIATVTLDPATVTKTPYMWVAPQSGSGELTDNQSDFAHDLLVGIALLDSDLTATAPEKRWQQALLACTMYRDVLFRMLVRRDGSGNGYGRTLNGGGTYCPGAVTIAQATGYEYLEFSDDDNGWGGFQVLARVTIQLDEEYPA